MAISIVSGVTNSASNASGSETVAASADVTSGDLIIICCAAQTQTDEGVFSVGDLTKDSGTSTIDTIVLDYASDWANNSSSWNQLGTWSFLCTGTGSLTMAFSTTGSPIKSSMGILSYSSDGDGWDGDRVEDTGTTGDGSGTTVTTGNATSVGDAVFVGALTCLSNQDPTPVAGSAFVERVDQQQAGSGARHQLSIQDQIVTTGTTDASDWSSLSSSTQENHSHLTVYKEAPASGATPHNAFGHPFVGCFGGPIG